MKYEIATSQGVSGASRGKRGPTSAPVSNDDRLYRNFTKRLEKRGDCLVWGGYVNKAGYGQIPRYTYGHTLAHRYAYAHINGEPKDRNISIRHTCGNLACVKIEHLYESPVGHWLAKLCRSEVLVIKKRILNGETAISIARDYGVHKATIYGIKWGNIWRRSPT